MGGLQIVGSLEEGHPMRGNSCVPAVAGLSALAVLGVPCLAATFGTVVAIGGQAADIALDESRGVLYLSLIHI